MIVILLKLLGIFIGVYIYRCVLNWKLIWNFIIYFMRDKMFFINVYGKGVFVL